MAGIILKKAGKMPLIIMKIFLYMAWLLARAACFLAKLFLLVLVLAIRMVLVVSGLSIRE